VVGIAGASGVISGTRLLQLPRDHDVETHLVMTNAAKVTLAYESGLKAAQVHALADVVYREGDIPRRFPVVSFATMA
jgi:4-hydroxy-3-polyprenylbenzoate decarboxylase